MIDFLLKYDLSPACLSEFVAHLCECSPNQVVVIDLDSFCDLREEVQEDINCLCVYCKVKGDASMLIQLYRYFFDDDLLLKRLLETAPSYRVTCYVPIDNFNEWLLIEGDGPPVRVRQIESESDDFFAFELI